MDFNNWQVVLVLTIVAVAAYAAGRAHEAFKNRKD